MARMGFAGADDALELSVREQAALRTRAGRCGR